MWGIVVGILGAAVTLSVAQTLLEKDPNKPEASTPTARLAEPDKNSKPKSDGNFTAPMWRQADAREVLNKAKRFGSKLK